MEIFIGWIVLSSVIAVIGDTRKIGSFKAFFLSIFLSPIIGLIVTLSSKRNDTIAFENALLDKQNISDKNYIDEMYKLQKLYESKAIDEDYYITEKERLEKYKIINKRVLIYDSKNRSYSIRINHTGIVIKLKSSLDDCYEFNTQQQDFILSIIPKSIFLSPKSYKLSLNQVENIFDIAELVK